MARRGRPRATWEHLRERGARRSVWQRRKLETDANPAVTDYLAATALELESFSRRCIPTDTLTRNLDGSTFSWPANQWLTKCRDYAQGRLADPECPEYTKEICTRFIQDLATSADHCWHMDVVGCANVEKMYAAWGSPDTKLNMLRLLAVVEWLGWKDATGQMRFENERLLDFHEADITVLDQMILALQAQAATASVNR